MTTVHRRLSAVAAALALSACTTYESLDYAGEASYQLAEFTDTDGRTEIFELRISSSNVAHLRIHREAVVGYEVLGLHLDELDKEKAEKCEPKTRPYSGLLVRSVDAGSPAAEAGLVANDLVLAIDGEDVFYLVDYNRIVARLSARKPVELRVRGRDQPVRLVPQTRLRTERKSTTVPLESIGRRNPKPYAGIDLRVIPKEYSERVFGDDRNAIVIARVAVGSPAYLAGLRAGDIIERVEGRPTPDGEALLDLVRESGARREPIEVDVVRDRGRRFSTVVYLDDYSGTTAVTVPGVFRVRSGPKSTTWEILPWGVLSDYYNSYTATKSREAEEHGFYRMLFGLFEYRWSPSDSHTRLFWFIRFG